MGKQMRPLQGSPEGDGSPEFWIRPFPVAPCPAVVSPPVRRGEAVSDEAAPPPLVPSSYYTKKQQALRLNPGWKGRSRGHSGAARTHAGLTFFCQAARLGGLSSAELERSLHTLHKAGAPRAGQGAAGGGTLAGGLGTSLSFSSHRLPRARCVQPLLSDT